MSLCLKWIAKPCKKFLKIWSPHFRWCLCDSCLKKELSSGFDKPKPASNTKSIALASGKEIAKIEKKKPEEKIAKSIVKNQKLKNPTIQNTATVINAIDNPVIEQKDTSKKSWFMNFLDKIFSIF